MDSVCAACPGTCLCRVRSLQNSSWLSSERDQRQLFLSNLYQDVTRQAAVLRIDALMDAEDSLRRVPVTCTSLRTSSSYFQSRLGRAHSDSLCTKNTCTAWPVLIHRKVQPGSCDRSAHAGHCLCKPTFDVRNSNVISVMVWLRHKGLRVWYIRRIPFGNIRSNFVYAPMISRIKHASKDYPPTPFAKHINCANLRCLCLDGSPSAVTPARPGHICSSGPRFEYMGKGGRV